MVDGISIINTTIAFQKKGGAAVSLETDIFKFDETAVDRTIDYSKVIGGLILPRYSTTIFKDVTFDFVTGDVSIEALFGSNINYGTLTFTAGSGTFEVNDLIIGSTSGATARVMKISGSTLTLSNIVGVFNASETITETSPDTVTTGTTTSLITVIGTTFHQDWDTFDSYRITLDFSSDTETYIKSYYDCVIKSIKTNINDDVTTNTIVFSLPMKNIDGESTYAVFDNATDLATKNAMMGY